MKNQYKGIIMAFALFAIVLQSCKKDDSSTPSSSSNTTSNPERIAALNDYNANYLGTYVSIAGWTGNTSTCSAGSVSQATRNAVIQRINYFRRMVGLNDQCTLDSTLFAQEQETALMMTANNQLNHFPPNTWTCWTTSGYNGAGSSNIALGFGPSDAVTAFINDFGTGNEMVGHRRWLLHSKKQSFSFGSTNNAMAIYVFKNDTNTHVPSYIAYPPKGYVPQPLIFGRWSFGIPSADFSGASVSMTGPGGTPVSLTVISSTANGYGDNTIVWEPVGINTSSTSDVTYSVTVSGISSASQTSYTYNVTIFKP